ncbi:MAG: nucleotidyltransferase domain-containing protein [Chromatiaceae bacterium]
MTKSELQDLSERFIRDRLRERLPPGVGVYLFGSRARRTASWNSDYDLWVDAQVPERTIHEILEEIDESFVPYKVDIVTTADLRGPFADRVRSEAIRWM